MPAPGAPEAVISEGLAHNKKLKLGGLLADPTDTGTLVPAPDEDQAGRHPERPDVDGVHVARVRRKVPLAMSRSPCW